MVKKFFLEMGKSLVIFFAVIFLYAFVSLIFKKGGSGEG
ncbi:MAG: hypothetical protein PWQ91_1048 [Eubacteriales bacterium]|nr:hypothetical protein [Eubacteriales bacterium]